MSTSMDLPSHIQMSCPLGLAVSERGDAVVSDWKSSRLLFLGTDGFPKVRMSYQASQIHLLYTAIQLSLLV